MRIALVSGSTLESYQVEVEESVLTRGNTLRLTLGAGRARLALQVISECFALALAGGIAGLGLAIGLVQIITVLGPASMPGLRDVGVNARTAAFAMAASVLSAVLAGAIPAVGVIRTRLASWLADRSGGSGPGGLRAQQALVVGQIGMAVALLVTAALLVESFRQLRAVGDFHASAFIAQPQRAAHRLEAALLHRNTVLDRVGQQLVERQRNRNRLGFGQHPLARRVAANLERDAATEGALHRGPEQRGIDQQDRALAARGQRVREVGADRADALAAARGGHGDDARGRTAHQAVLQLRELVQRRDRDAAPAAQRARARDRGHGNSVRRLSRRFGRGGHD